MQVSASLQNVIYCALSVISRVFKLKYRSRVGGFRKVGGALSSENDGCLIVRVTYSLLVWLAQTLEVAGG